MYLNEFPKVKILLDELSLDIQNTLEDNLVGLYIYGSLVLGDFDEKISDIDLLAAIKRPITDEEFQKLQTMHDNFIDKHPSWRDRVEVQYLSLDALKTFKTKESEVVTISPGQPLEKIMVGKHWLMNWYMVQENGHTLLGPDPKTIIEPISKEEFIQSVIDHTKNWNEWVKGMHLIGSQAYAVLTMCRAFYAYQNSKQTSKILAARYTQEKFPQYYDLIQKAIKWREVSKKDNQEDKENFPKTEEFVNFIRNQILES